MKTIKFSKTFYKHFKKRIQGNQNLEQRFVDRVNAFQKDKTNPVLKDHALIGKRKGMRAFSVGGDLRIIYFETQIAYQFIDIGSHNQVY